MPTTSKGLRYPASSAAPNVPQDIQNLASDVNTKMATHLGSGFLNSNGYVILAAFSAWTDIAQVTATSNGNACVVNWVGTGYNGNSGADRDMNWRITVDGTSIGQILTIPILLSNVPHVTKAGTYTSTPAAGAHTWKLQASASAATSVLVEAGMLQVIQQ